ncbi:MAG: hypothetical protein R2849_01120 [Thermomicrobiales bacterium]
MPIDLSTTGRYPEAPWSGPFDVDSALMDGVDLRTEIAVAGDLRRHIGVEGPAVVRIAMPYRGVFRTDR